MIIKIYNNYIKNNKKFNFKQFKKHIREEHNIIMNYSSKEFYDLIHNISEPPKCPTCGKYLKFKTFDDGYQVYCSKKCSNSNPDKIKKGNEWYNDKKKLSARKKKYIETIKNKYGCEFYTQSNEFKSKAKEKINEKYGCFNSAQIHIKHFEDLNKNFFLENFVKGNIIYLHLIKNYFGMGYDGARSWIKRLGLEHLIICKGNNVSAGEKEWLNLIGMPNDNKHRQVRLLKKYKVDGFDPEYNYVYEYCGDFFHGNPDIYDLNKLNEKVHKTYLELLIETKEKFDCLIDNGYEVYYTWETDFKNRDDIVWATKYNKGDFDKKISKYLKK